MSFPFKSTYNINEFSALKWQTNKQTDTNNKNNNAAAATEAAAAAG